MLFYTNCFGKEGNIGVLIEMYSSVLEIILTGKWKQKPWIFFMGFFKN